MYRIPLLPRISLYISGPIPHNIILLFVPQATYQFGAEITAPRSAMPTQERNVAVDTLQLLKKEGLQAAGGRSPSQTYGRREAGEDMQK